jgi:hypothetical protein
MIDFQEFKREYVNENLPKLYTGELDVTIIELVGNVNFEEMREFNKAAFNLWALGTGQPMDELLEKLAIEYLSDAAKHEYKNMIAAAEDEAGAERAFYNLNR